MPPLVSSLPFVGRVKELQQLREAVNNFLKDTHQLWPSSYRGQQLNVYFISGKRGVGKSQLCEQLLDTRKVWDFPIQLPFFTRLKIVKVLERFNEEERKNPDLIYEAISNSFKSSHHYKFTDYSRKKQELNKIQSDLEKALREDPIKESDLPNNIGLDVAKAGIDLVELGIRLGALVINGFALVGVDPKDVLAAMDLTKRSIAQIDILFPPILAAFKEKLQKHHFNVKNYNEVKIGLREAFLKDLRRYAEEEPLIIFIDNYEEFKLSYRLLIDLIFKCGPRILWLISGNIEKNNKVISQFRDKFRSNFHFFEIGPLSLDDIVQWIKQDVDRLKLKTTQSDVLCLAEDIFKRTQGYPQYVGISIELLHRNNFQIPDNDFRNEFLLSDSLMGEYFDILENGEKQQSHLKLLIALAILTGTEKKDLLDQICAPEDTWDLIREIKRNYPYLLDSTKIQGDPELNQSFSFFLKDKLLNQHYQRAIRDDIHRIARDYYINQQEKAQSIKNNKSIREFVVNKQWQELETPRLYHVIQLDSIIGFSQLSRCFLAAWRYDQEWFRSLTGILKDLQNTLQLSHYRKIIVLCERVTKNDALIEDKNNLLSLLATECGVGLEPVEENFLSPSPKPDGKNYVQLINSTRAKKELYEIVLYLRSSFEEGISDRVGREVDANIVAKKDDDKSSTMDKPTPGAYLLAGKSKMEIGDFSRAHEDFKKALDIDQKNVPAILGIAQVYMQDKKWDEAKKYILMAISHEPKNVTALSLLGQCWREKGELDKAVILFQEALQEAESDPLLHLALGEIYVALNRLDEARNEFEWAIEYGGKFFPQARIALGNLKLSTKEYIEAESMFRHVLMRDQLNIDALRGAATVALKRGSYQSAIQFYERILINNEDSVEVKMVLAFLHIREGNIGKAETYLEYSRNLLKQIKNASYEWACLEAISLFEAPGSISKKEVNKVIDHLEKAFRLDPQYIKQSKEDLFFEVIRSTNEYQKLLNIFDPEGRPQGIQKLITPDDKPLIDITNRVPGYILIGCGKTLSSSYAQDIYDGLGLLKSKLKKSIRNRQFAIGVISIGNEPKEVSPLKNIDLFQPPPEIPFSTSFDLFFAFRELLSMIEHDFIVAPSSKFYKAKVFLIIDGKPEDGWIENTIKIMPDISRKISELFIVGVGSDVNPEDFSELNKHITTNISLMTNVPPVGEFHSVVFPWIAEKIQNNPISSIGC
jgi:tetratricopeptide (TPR) repeat protein